MPANTAGFVQRAPSPVLKVCSEWCSASPLGYTVMALTTNTTDAACWCGFTYTPGNAALCDTPCATPDSAHLCGGAEAFSVYTLAPVAAAVVRTTWAAPPHQRDFRHCLAYYNAERCICREWELLTGVFRNSTYNGLSTIGKMACASPYSDMVDTQVSCSVSARSNDYPGTRLSWMQCAGNQVLKGWRNRGSAILSEDTLDAIENLYCCDAVLGGVALQRGPVRVLDVRDCMKKESEGFCSVPENAFVVGMFRGDCDQADCIHFLKYAYFEEPGASLAPTTPYPLGLDPVTVAPTAGPTEVPATVVPTVVPAMGTVVPLPSVPATQVPETVAPVAVPGDTEVPVFTSDVPDTTAPSAGATSVPGTVPVQGTFAPSVLSSLVPVDDVTTEPATATAAATETEAPLLAAPVPTAAPARVVVGTPDSAVSSGGQSAAIAATVTMGASAGAATRLVLVSQRCTLSGQKELPLPLHPLRFHLGGSVAAGAVVGNLSICFVLTLIAKLVLFFAHSCHCNKAEDLRAVIRFPSIPLFAFYVLYQGTSFAGLVLLFDSAALYSLAGVATVVLCVAVPVGLFKVLSHGGDAAVYYVDPQRSWWLRCIAGRGEWLSLKREYHWVYRYASVMRSFRPGVVWFSVIEFAASFALAATQAFATPDMVACGHARLAGGCIFLIMFTLELYLKPHVRFRDNIIDPAVLLLQAVALFLTSAGYYMEDPDGATFSAANSVLTAAVVALVCRASLDIVAEIAVFTSRSRMTLQRRVWEHPLPSPTLHEEHHLHTAEPEAVGTLFAASPRNRSSTLTPSGSPRWDSGVNEMDLSHAGREGPLFCLRNHRDVSSADGQRSASFLAASRVRQVNDHHSVKWLALDPSISASRDSHDTDSPLLLSELSPSVVSPAGISERSGRRRHTTLVNPGLRSIISPTVLTPPHARPSSRAGSVLLSEAVGAGSGSLLGEAAAGSAGSLLLGEVAGGSASSILVGDAAAAGSGFSASSGLGGASTACLSVLLSPAPDRCPVVSPLDIPLAPRASPRPLVSLGRFDDDMPAL